MYKKETALRSQFLRTLAFASAGAIILFSCKEKAAEKPDPWEAMDAIIASVKEPTFADSIFNVMDFGAVADSTTLNTSAFKSAIEECSQNGGGTVLVPKGTYLTGAIHLEDNVNLHISEGAELRFSKDHNQYPLVHTSYEGTELINFSPLIYAYKKKNIAITGKGVLNGQAGTDNWWPWCGKDTYGWKEGMPTQLASLKRLKEEMSEKGAPVSDRIFGEGYHLRPTFIEPFECTNVLIQGITITNAPFWVIHPMKSNKVIVDGVTVDSHGPNNDGCDPEYSKDVIIKNCTFNTGDDCIAIKSGRDEEGRRVAIKSENIVVQNCKMIDGHGGVVMGSEISAGVKNVFVENCQMDSPNLDRAIRIKSNSRRGGLVENVYVRNVEVGQVKEAVLKINMFYGIYANQTGKYIPEVKNINLENVRVKNGGKYGILAKGYAERPIKDITFKDVVIEKVDSIHSLQNVANITFINTTINGEVMKSIQN